LLDVAARDRCHLQLAPAGQGETTDQGIALSPCLVVLLGVLLNVFAGEIGKRASPALSLLLGGRIAAPGDGKHCFGTKCAGVAEPDSLGIAMMEPTRATTAAVYRDITFGPGRLHAQR